MYVNYTILKNPSVKSSGEISLGYKEAIIVFCIVLKTLSLVQLSFFLGRNFLQILLQNKMNVFYNNKMVARQKLLCKM